MAFNVQINQKANITVVDQSTGEKNIVNKELACCYPFAWDYRQARASSAYDIQVMNVYTHIPKERITEGMRIDYGEEDFRIQSVTKWPRINPKYLSLIVQGDGHG